LYLTVEPRLLPTFFHLLQDGFLLEARVGCSTREFLRDRCRLSPEFIANRIGTLFLNGQPVDDLDNAYVEDGCTLALSGAMPGLVGAVMRSNSPLRSFRGSITHAGDKGSRQHHQQRDGLVRLKLFNTVMSELGLAFLSEGILLEPLVVQNSLPQQSAVSRGGFREILLDREPVDFSLLLDEDFSSGSTLISLVVKAQK